MGRAKKRPAKARMKDNKRPKVRLSHLDAGGQARMVDVSEKSVTRREAVATAALHIRPGILDALFAGELGKGDALGTARIAGIQAAKRTPEWIPLCHVLPLDFVGVEFVRESGDVLVVTCRARATARTGVEMEALTGAAAAALTIYDMTKAADKSIEIGPIRLEQKSGGKSGEYRRNAETPKSQHSEAARQSRR